MRPDIFKNLLLFTLSSYLSTFAREAWEDQTIFKLVAGDLPLCWSNTDEVLKSIVVYLIIYNHTGQVPSPWFSGKNPRYYSKQCNDSCLQSSCQRIKLALWLQVVVKARTLSLTRWECCILFVMDLLKMTSLEAQLSFWQTSLLQRVESPTSSSEGCCSSPRQTDTPGRVSGTCCRRSIRRADSPGRRGTLRCWLGTPRSAGQRHPAVLDKDTLWCEPGTPRGAGQGHPTVRAGDTLQCSAQGQPGPAGKHLCPAVARVACDMMRSETVS